MLKMWSPKFGRGTVSWLLVCALVANIRCYNEESSCADNNWHTLETPESARANCGAAFQNRCECRMACYDGRHQFVVKCIDSKFTDTKPLENLPNATEVLIFTGNYIEKLPWNVFGTRDIPGLRVIDMSSNKIREIHGKSYHHVQNVERLILDFNELSLDSEIDHPRVFSNFASLLELHLTDAFEDAPKNGSSWTTRPTDLATFLHDIFVNSNLTQLIKLHLEQNEISEFRDPNVFCDLPNLRDLHLGDNALTALHFNLSCLHNLRFLDLQRNHFTRVLDRDLRTLDTFAKHNQSVTIDLTSNPFECSCKLNPFIKWMRKTKISVRNENVLKCTEHGQKTLRPFQETKNCPSKLAASNSLRGSAAAITVLSLLLVALICALIYVQREELKKKLGPVIESVNRRVRYTSIATGEARENEV
ncbi:vasorin [Venturia canescens]|uniref:vasorin n=1 Tax=Venturia canescens TaxID=32260 RepID=UPI001C9CE413|nr:vasorin [Venturia canescens]